MYGWNKKECSYLIRSFILFVQSFISWYWNLFLKPRDKICYICVALYLDWEEIMFEFDGVKTNLKFFKKR